MNNNIKAIITVVPKWIMLIFYMLLAYLPCRWFYEYHFCPGILFYYMIPDEALMAVFLACCWGIWSTVSAKKLNANYWFKSIIIVIVYFSIIF